MTPLTVTGACRAHRTVPNVRALLRAARARAYERVANALDAPIALVAAPPGFGKSTVVRDVFAAGGHAYRLLSLPRDGRGVLDVLRALTACMADAAPALASSFVGVYDRVADASDAIDQLAVWTAGQLGVVEATVLVDELAGDANDPAAAFIAALIDRCGDRLRWIVLAEKCEGFPIARWMAEDRIAAPVDAGDLALTADDLLGGAGAALAPLDARGVRRLCDLSAGWPAAIALGLVSRTDLDLDRAPAEPAALYAYLANAALDALDDRGRDFVDQTCFFETFDTALLECAGLFGFDETLVRLRDDLGVLAFDSRGNYQYSRHFRAFALERLERRADGSYALVAARSAGAYERDGRYAEAIDVAIARGDQEALGVILTAHGYAMIDRGESGAVGRALAAVPHDILLDFPMALAVKATLESLHGKIDVAEAWFRLALDRCAASHARTIIVYRFALDLVRRERPDAVDVLEPVATTIEPNAALAAPLLALLATAYALHGRLADASQTMDRALRLRNRVTDPGAHAKVLCQAGYVALHVRDITAAKRFAQQAYAEAVAAYCYDVAARALSILYNIAVDYEDDVTAARGYLEQLTDASGRAGSRELLLYATLCLYEIEVYSGDVPAIARLDDILASLDLFYSVLTSETLLPSQALTAAWSGDFYRAYRLIESSARHQVSPDRRALRHAEIAVYAAAAGLRLPAAANAESALEIAATLAACDKVAIQTRAYVALTFVLLRRHGRAGKLLRDLSRHAAADTRTAVLVRAVTALFERWTSRTGTGYDVAGALEALEHSDLGGIARMIEALPLPQTARASIAHLTPAERDVLVRLAAGRTAAQIAAAERTDVAAIDAHVAVICRKLGCHGHKHAVALALTEGLLLEQAQGA